MGVLPQHSQRQKGILLRFLPLLLSSAQKVGVRAQKVGPARLVRAQKVGPDQRGACGCLYSASSCRAYSLGNISSLYKVAQSLHAPTDLVKYHDPNQFLSSTGGSLACMCPASYTGQLLPYTSCRQLWKES